MTDIPIDTTFSMAHLIEPVLVAVALAMFAWMVAAFLIGSTDSLWFDKLVFSTTLAATMLVPIVLVGTIIAIPAGWHDVQPTKASVSRVVDTLGGAMVDHNEHSLANKLRTSCEMAKPSAFAVKISDDGYVKEKTIEVSPGTPCVATVAKADR